MPVAFFTACLTMESDPEKADEVRAYTDKLLAETGIEPFEYGTFAGWFEPEEFGFVERKILEKMNAVPGDFRDWDAITAWTKQAEARAGLLSRSFRASRAFVDAPGRVYLVLVPGYLERGACANERCRFGGAQIRRTDTVT